MQRASVIIAAGASGYMLKNRVASELFSAMRTVLRGDQGIHSPTPQAVSSAKIRSSPNCGVCMSHLRLPRLCGLCDLAPRPESYG
jgi:DNA-binding NarL/FixJ family response regulator